MLIDWFTTLAQIVNFLVLVVVLKYVLYDRIVDAMEKRERNIAARFESADETRSKAQKELEKYRSKVEDMREEKERKVREAKKVAEEYKERLIKEAGQEADNKRRQWLDELEREKQEFLESLSLRISEEVYNIAKASIRKMADKDMQQEMVEIFTEELEALSVEEKQKIRQDLGEDRKAAVRSPFKMEDQSTGKIERAIKYNLEEDMEIEFETDESMIMGIVMETRGHKVSWTIDGFLEKSEENVLGFIEHKIMER